MSTKNVFCDPWSHEKNEKSVDFSMFSEFAVQNKLFDAENLMSI